jgi:membrane-associated phospholipid phosphatase
LLALPRQMVSKAVLIVLVFALPLRAALAQTDPELSPRHSAPLPQAQQTLERQVSWKQLLPNVRKDQKVIWWEFPKDLGRGEHWLPTSLTLAGTAGLTALDPHVEPYFRRTTTFQGFNRVMSFNGTITAMAAVPATTYFVGLVTHKSYAKQTAQLTVESLIAAGVPALVTRDITRRLPPSDIPPYGDFSDSWFRSHRGPFYLGPGGFPSGHTLSAFSVATVFSERYRNHRWVKWVAYTGAGAIAFSRITKQAHFPSDVFVGAVLGYSTARFVVLSH